LLQYEPGLQWLCGLDGINHHTLSDFRVKHKKALDELFAQMLALLEKEELLSLERVMHDGTKVRAYAGGNSFRREKTVKEHLERARELVKEMGDPREERSRRQAAQDRAARELAERMERVAEQLTKLQQEKEPAEREQVRVSRTEPEARLMKHGDHAIVPSYNLQISTDAKEKAIVGMHLSTCSSDAESLPAAVEEIERNLGRKPEQIVVDGGFTNRGGMEAMAAQDIEMFGSLTNPEERSAAAMKAMGIDPGFAPQFFIWEEASNTMRCPADKPLGYVGQSRKNGNLLPPVSGADSRLRRLRLAFQVLSEIVARTDGVPPGGGEPGGGRPAPPDGDAGSEGHLSSALGSGGVSERLAQRENRPSQVPRTRKGESGDGSSLGLSDL
jgi:hypothetical protein